MAWSQVEISKPHLAYAIIGGFTSLFMLCSLIIKEKLFLGEATMATATGLIFGPYVAKLFVPTSWGNTDYITEELARVLLVVEVFAAGAELPRAYMLRHWRSMFVMLLPVMIFGWLVSTGFMYALIPRLSFLESLAIAACITATDPVLASSIVGKGKFARRVPGHLRNMLLAESGCNDGMAIPFLYLAIYLIIEKPARHAGRDWVCIIILYECTFGCVLGAIIGVIARKMIKFSERRGLMDRESFLVFYFVLALFCGGIGTIIGVDDLLVSFCAGAAFSWDSWFSKKTEESHVSNVIDLLLNLSFFVYVGAIMPWPQFHMPHMDLSVWRLVVLAICILIARRIPAVLLFKSFVPDIINWREALFAGHFGPIGVGALYTCLVARAELEVHSTVPEPNDAIENPEIPNWYCIQVMWPVVCFLVLSSIIVHGSSIAFFMLGKRINTLALSFTRTRDSHFAFNLPRVRQGQSLPIKRVDALRSSANSIASSIRRRHPVNIQEDEDADISTVSLPEAAHLREERAESPRGGHYDAEEFPSEDYESRQPRRSNEEDREEEMNPGDETYLIGEDLVVEDSQGNIISHTSSRDANGPSIDEKLAQGDPKAKSFGRKFRSFLRRSYDTFQRNLHEPDDERQREPTLGHIESSIENHRPRYSRQNSESHLRENSVERRRREQVLTNIGDSESEDDNIPRPGIVPFYNENNESSSDTRNGLLSDNVSESRSRRPSRAPSAAVSSEGSPVEEDNEAQHRPNIRFLELPVPGNNNRRRSHSSYRRGSFNAYS
ncbi:putative Na(+)/H(+) antiporter C3A11.09 [Schizosaccharomyces pombe]|uniref:Probable Na(+)/H(+) antiporter sod22 n=1 Tax=Schizosaccharomyces pombe (strain 972 / ATCC 24843) TaxID=284812 RepID=NAH2_SCHPO